MNNYQTKIEELLTQAVTEKTFSLEIIEKIKSLRDGFESSAKLVDELNERLKFIQKDNEEKSNEIQKLTSIVDSYKKRESALSTSERLSEKKDYELEFQKKRADEIKELFGIVFKNPLVRKSTYNNVSDYGSTKNESGGITEEHE